MSHLTKELTNKPVVTEDGTNLGTVNDVLVEPDSGDINEIELIPHESITPSRIEFELRGNYLYVPAGRVRSENIDTHVVAETR